MDEAVGAVIAAGQFAGVRGWVPATSGNFSVRIDADLIAITRSGIDKSRLSAADVLIQPLDAPLPPGSSAEAALHVERYRAEREIGAIFHIHGLYSTVISRLYAGIDAVILQGWELQKAFSGIKSHKEKVAVPLFANDQDIERLSARVKKRLSAPPDAGTVRAPGYLLAGHGLYAFGASPAVALRHLEAFEALFQQLVTLGSHSA